MAGGLGFEPRQTDPESVVLPLHHPPSNQDYFSIPSKYLKPTPEPGFVLCAVHTVKPQHKFVGTFDDKSFSPHAMFNRLRKSSLIFPDFMMLEIFRKFNE